MGNRNGEAHAFLKLKISLKLIGNNDVGVKTEAFLSI